VCVLLPPAIDHKQMIAPPFHGWTEVRTLSFVGFKVADKWTRASAAISADGRVRQTNLFSPVPETREPPLP